MLSFLVKIRVKMSLAKVVTAIFVLFKSVPFQRRVKRKGLSFVNPGSLPTELSTSTATRKWALCQVRRCRRVPWKCDWVNHFLHHTRHCASVRHTHASWWDIVHELWTKIEPVQCYHCYLRHITAPRLCQKELGPPIQQPFCGHLFLCLPRHSMTLLP